MNCFDQVVLALAIAEIGAAGRPRELALHALQLPGLFRA
jgi:hypothetical protein